MVGRLVLARGDGLTIEEVITMRCLILTMLFTTFTGCDREFSRDIPLSYDYHYTIPFKKSVMLTVWNPQQESVELHNGVGTPLLAPGHVIVTDVFHNEVAFTDYEYETMLVLEGVDDLYVDIGAELCAGDEIGRSQQVRIKAFWGQESHPYMSDMSVVRVVRNSMMTDLSDMRYADMIHSVIPNPGTVATSTEFNRDDCPFGGE
jgi:hypothetical protein